MKGSGSCLFAIYGGEHVGGESIRNFRKCGILNNYANRHNARDMV